MRKSLAEVYLSWLNLILKLLQIHLKKRKSKLPPHIKRWHGAFKNEDDRDYKEIIAEAIWDKYNK